MSISFSEQSYRKLAAALLVLGAVLANIAFIGLGSVFNYPDILQEPAKEILRQFMANQSAIIFWFSILAIGAGLLAPIAVILGRLGSSRMAVWIGVLAAVVQVIGLSRWILIVPGLAQKGDVATFQLLNTILGTIVGETFGYLFTGVWTILIIRSLGKNIGSLWFSWLGIISAILIMLGLLIPFGVPGADSANFIGYILWSIWLVALGVLIWKGDDRKH
ncbi:hypothetical protein METP2_02799 [Methanosarcinales archaeon]|nr:hypothetical protein METP2_02799 [Methanosarcinales archaeon]